MARVPTCPMRLKKTDFCVYRFLILIFDFWKQIFCNPIRQALLYVRTWYESHTKMKTWIFKLNWDVALYCTYVRTSYVSHTKMLFYIVSAYQVPGIILSSRAIKTAFSPTYTQKNISSFGGMYQKKQLHQQSCTLLYMCHVFFLGGVRIFLH